MKCVYAGCNEEISVGGFDTRKYILCQKHEGEFEKSDLSHSIQLFLARANNKLQKEKAQKMADLILTKECNIDIKRILDSGKQLNEIQTMYCRKYIQYLEEEVDFYKILGED